MIDPKELEPYFGWPETHAKGFEPFNHDYQPALEPIRVPMVQDLPAKFHKVSGVNTDPIDPYLAIADMRMLFESKGRKLAGFLILPSFIVGGDGKKHSVKNHPPIHKMKSVTTSAAFGMHSMVREFGIHPLPILHLMVWMAYFERRAQFAYLRMEYEEGVRNGDEEAWKSLQMLKAFPGIEDYQWSAPQATRIMGEFPNDPIMRQMLMPPGMVTLPPESELGWVDMERGLKDTLERTYQVTGIGCDGVLIVATDMKGAIAVTSGAEGYNCWDMMTWGNDIFYAFLYDAIMWLVEVEVELEPHLGSEKEAFETLDGMMTQAYGIPLIEYFGRKIPEGSYLEDLLKSGVGDAVIEWHRERRKEFLEIQRRNGIKEDTCMGVVDE